ncbi:GNAT family N-acetyltransferase [Bradyrhizobium sp. WYCCWR 13023]|uniref:GNAT family N-acetyltransferase n=1 Tax=Bradyrhizobium zhengyangense TaxID=2911009 RepID=A0A9X1R5C3_9BRAD|nr:MULTISPECIES: GNAT family N-acetyltransferase [Bradyrhizobium]MCG2626554.1 GNAT family N-acetyltransferase [Bradyrhizobium zhengyangense]MCG2665673.1 GNAT family N-acetyltransferase [Bradyrhizobium zhengyangense]MDA9524076.1 GCN5 family acetyltransferase [Bradyrhizobium sp. CCBAU 11434]
MTDAASYSHRDTLRDGTPVEIRALRPEDAVEMLAALGQTSAQSRRRRFFIPKQHFSDRERDFFMEIDFEHHVALVACVDDAGIVGGGRYIVTEPGRAEMAFMVIDAWQGRGIGGLLLRHLIALARDAKLSELMAEVLLENAAMRRVFDRFGFVRVKGQDPDALHLELKLS